MTNAARWVFSLGNTEKPPYIWVFPKRYRNRPARSAVVFARFILPDNEKIARLRLCLPGLYAVSVQNIARSYAARWVFSRVNISVRYKKSAYAL
jgi:hypothetical protein